jgi:hypothetical protein
MHTFKILQVEQMKERGKSFSNCLIVAIKILFFRANLNNLIYEFQHNFSGKLFQSLLFLTTNEFSAVSTPARGVWLNLCALVVILYIFFALK